jgi:hypothetical protein
VHCTQRGEGAGSPFIRPFYYFAICRSTYCKMPPLT